MVYESVLKKEKLDSDVVLGYRTQVDHEWSKTLRSLHLKDPCFL